jgi:hypothetical protein
MDYDYKIVKFEKLLKNSFIYKNISFFIYIDMILGGLFISMALISYFIYKPKQSPKGSVGYYKQLWKELY